MQELRGLEGHLKLTFDPVQYIGYRGQYSFKESIILKSSVILPNSKKYYFFIAKKFSRSTDQKD